MSAPTSFTVKIIRRNISSAELLADLKSVADRLGTDQISAIGYMQLGAFSAQCFIARFGSWAAAVRQAGLSPARTARLNKEELIDNLKSLWQKLGRQPRAADLFLPQSRCSMGPYLRCFGSWTNALVALKSSQPPSSTEPPPARPIRQNTHINWRLRFAVLKRDHFRCRTCGKSPANDSSVVLQIDHIHPRSKGGIATIDNLQTLCARCNVGKSDG